MSDKYKDLQLSTIPHFYLLLLLHLPCMLLDCKAAAACFAQGADSAETAVFSASWPHAERFRKDAQAMPRPADARSESCGTSTWEDCMWAANVKVKTIQARPLCKGALFRIYRSW